MTSTSVLNRAEPVSTVQAWLRFAAAIVVIAAFTIGAFAIGRATSTSAARPASTPARVAPPMPAATPTTAPYLCRIGRPC
ncbi:MAG TPA: hypothetical protein VH914_19815 [Acidimicrobiia bacterium]|jgi:hypothetical protein|nr:hypothetical protein [Acidimicrobiia bacterium]